MPFIAQDRVHLSRGASFDASGAINYSINTYIEVFDQITWGALACVGVVLMIWLYQALKFRNRALALES